MRNSGKIFALVFLFALVHVLSTTIAVAQTDRAALEGTVTDPSGAFISGATVQILAVQTGQKLLIKNSDPVMHNVHSVPVDGNTDMNNAQGPGAPDVVYVAKKPENFLKFQCDIHNWMFAWVSVFDHPYFAVTDKDGKYTIKNVPDGKYTIQAFHRKAAPASSPKTDEVEVKGGSATKDFTLDAK